jgi:RNA polymerase sigma factor (sigma-70 family)
VRPERANDGVSAELSDAAVIERSLVDPHAFASIFDRHFDAVHGYARRRLGRSLAEEIASETFIRAFDRRDSFDVSRVDARPWLFGIAANLMRRHWRTERRRLGALQRLRPRGEDEMSFADDRADLVAALDALPVREREALLLYALADLSYEEIAAALDVPVGTVRSRLSRARDRIRKRLDTAIPEGVL